MLEMIWSKANTTLLLMGMEICPTTLEISMMVSQKIRNQPTVYFLSPPTPLYSSVVGYW